jgi:hypothetical protein
MQINNVCHVGWKEFYEEKQSKAKPFQGDGGHFRWNNHEDLFEEDI